MADVKLKPCPFCGGEAKMQSYYRDYAIYCRKCLAATRKFYPTREEAEQAWNRRASETTVNQYGDNCTHISNCGTLNLNL